MTSRWDSFSTDELITIRKALIEMEIAAREDREAIYGNQIDSKETERVNGFLEVELRIQIEERLS